MTALRLSEDVVRCIGAGERYVYRRNPGLTLITFTNLKRPSSKLHKVKGWFSSKGFIQLFYFGKKTSSTTRINFLLLVLYFMLLHLCLLFKNFLQFESPRLFLNQNKGCRSDFLTSRLKFSPGWCMALTPSFSESALNKESSGICFFFQHQNTGQT